MKISIIVPVYKVQKEKLKKCIKSALDQTYSDIELILVDDGSPDECPKILDMFAMKDSRIVVIHQNNKGLSGARNSGVKNVTGKYFMFVDGDDYIDDNAVSRLVKEVKLNHADIISSQLKAASKAEDIGNYPFENKKVYHTADELYYMRKQLLNFNANNNSSCGKLYKTSFILENNLFHNEKLRQGAEDLEFNFRVFKYAASIETICDGYYNCVYNERSITRSFDEKNEYLILDCFKTIRSEINNSEIELISLFYVRVLYAVVSTAISGFFNPTNDLTYYEQKKKYIKYVNNSIMREAMKWKYEKFLDKKRRIIITLIKHNFFFPICLLAKIRYKQKSIGRI